MCSFPALILVLFTVKFTKTNFIQCLDFDRLSPPNFTGSAFHTLAYEDRPWWFYMKYL